LRFASLILVTIDVGYYDLGRRHDRVTPNDLIEI